MCIGAQMKITQEAAEAIAERAVQGLFDGQALVSIDSLAKALEASVSTVKQDPDLPAAAIQSHRFTRYLSSDGRNFVARKIAAGLLSSAITSASLSARGKKASRAAATKRTHTAASQAESGPAQ